MQDTHYTVSQWVALFLLPFPELLGFAAFATVFLHQPSLGFWLFVAAFTLCTGLVAWMFLYWRNQIRQMRENGELDQEDVIINNWNGAVK